MSQMVQMRRRGDPQHDISSELPRSSPGRNIERPPSTNNLATSMGAIPCSSRAGSSRPGGRKPDRRGSGPRARPGSACRVRIPRSGRPPGRLASWHGSSVAVTQTSRAGGPRPARAGRKRRGPAGPDPLGPAVNVAGRPPAGPSNRKSAGAQSHGVAALQGRRIRLGPIKHVQYKRNAWVA